jgi:hypothetical protein
MKIKIIDLQKKNSTLNNLEIFKLLYCFADIMVNILIKKSYEIYLNEVFLSIHKFTDIFEVKLFKQKF